MTPNSERQKILYVYGLFGSALTMGLLPFLWAAILCAVLLIVLLVAVSVLGRGKEQSSLTHSHTNFISRTLWIGSLYALILSAIGGFYLAAALDYTPLDPCLHPTSADLDRVQNYQDATIMVQGCQDKFLAQNWTLLLYTGILTIGPVVLFCLVRLVRGIRAVRSAQPVKNQKSWF